MASLFTFGKDEKCYGGRKKIPVIFFFCCTAQRALNLIGPGRATTWDGMKGT